MACFELSSKSPYELILKALSLIPISHYSFGFLSLLCLFLYNFLEIHFLEDLLTGFRGQPVSLTFNSGSQVYHEVVSKCKTLHGRFLSTPWLASPHLQTVLLEILGKAPTCNFQRQIFRVSDGGTIALDWLRSMDVKEPSLEGFDGILIDDKIPIMVVIPGLASDANAAYIRHLASKLAKNGWNVVVSNHVGFGGVPITSDRVYNVNWTEDARDVIDHLHSRYPQTPLFAIGTSMGANILVKYLGKEGANTPILGAAAVCSPWDILIGDRFINRNLAQRIYNRVLATGLIAYAKQHQSTFSRLADMEAISKSRSIREYDYHATTILGKFESPDEYYRKASCASYVGGVKVPLLGISALDDPVCTREAIPFDECRGNKNVVLATTPHGGHLGHVEGMSGKSIWWVRVVDEYFSALRSSPLIHRNKIQNNTVDGIVTAFSNDRTGDRIRGVDGMCNSKQM